MNFNKEIKNTHEEILKLHDKFQMLNDNVSTKLDSLTQIISENYIKKDSFVSEPENTKILEEATALNKINITIQQPRLINTILVVMIFINICFTGAFLLK
jgi:hypothetical protein